MAPQTLKQHPGKLVALTTSWLLLIQASTSIHYFINLTVIVEYRIVPQHDLTHEYLHQRLGRCPTPMSRRLDTS
jgi:hypothetical protein